MTEPLFLSPAEVLDIHSEQTEIYGGTDGVRDIRLLESALAMPRTGIDRVYFHPDAFAMAAAYLFHIVRNHPFVDGNKRTGLACAYLFLAINGFALECNGDTLADMVVAVARSGMSKEEIAIFLREKSTKYTL